ncbi:MAG: sugar phosphate isomerase/epimerase [Gemmataceae bacterium]|nr:sugar phosphate isomerase/epimerase [Gemmataceae bacterium]MDW8266856.1 sugar phosphate isomerase/epimerase [Gemmataceae bacterium]
MQLGFVSAILGEMSLSEVLAFAADEGFACVELMCWPPGAADRRYAGVCHIDVTNFDDDKAQEVRSLVHTHGVAISGLGYYPNPLDPNLEHRQRVITHLERVITAAAHLGVGIVNTFIGRDPALSVDANWSLFRAVWPRLVRHAEAHGVTLGLENCPMLFSLDEWPGGKNLAVSPAIWRTIFQEIPSDRLGLNFDPSHLVWQHIDYVRCIREFGRKIVHVHAKDTRIDTERLYERGILGLGWHTPKLPGLGDVHWGAFFSALTDAGYHGPVCIEVEDRAYEGSLADRKRALRQSKRFLEQFVS